MLNYIVVDVEADGACPGLYSMIEIGAVNVFTGDEFFVQLKPLTQYPFYKYSIDALNAIGRTREETLQYPLADEGIEKFYNWVKQYKRPMFVSDNNGFDWQFVNFYFHWFMQDNPFGHSSMNLGSFYKGIECNMFSSFKKLRDTKHDHNALNDARGNAEALKKIFAKYGVKCGK